MLFPTHLVFGILLSLIFDLSIFPVVLGSVFPDIVDKPLGSTNLVSYYQTVCHSGTFLLLVSLCSACVWYMFEYITLGYFAIGMVGHILLDITNMVVNSRPDHYKFLFWPFDYQSDPLKLPPFEFYRHYKGTRSFYFEIIIWVSTIGVITVNFL